MSDATSQVALTVLSYTGGVLLLAFLAVASMVVVAVSVKRCGRCGGWHEEDRCP